MNNWLKIAREAQVDKEIKKLGKTQTEKRREQEMLAAEKNWMERVTQRVQEIAEEMVFVGMTRKPNGMELLGLGKVDIQFLGHQNFAVKFFNVQKAGNVTTTRPIRIYHHRVARVRELNSHNIEELLKFAALGVDKYIEISTLARIERNLKTLIEAVNQDEHVETWE